MLLVEEIHTYYGESHALQGVSLEVKTGEVVCILGRNGAGKSTTLKSIMGLTPPKRGRVRFEGDEIQGGRLIGLPAAASAWYRRIGASSPA